MASDPDDFEEQGSTHRPAKKISISLLLRPKTRLDKMTKSRECSGSKSKKITALTRRVDSSLGKLVSPRKWKPKNYKPKVSYLKKGRRIQNHSVIDTKLLSSAQQLKNSFLLTDRSKVNRLRVDIDELGTSSSKKLSRVPSYKIDSLKPSAFLRRAPSAKTYRSVRPKSHLQTEPLVHDEANETASHFLTFLDGVDEADTILLER
jgi:hypothetical protein